MFETLSPSPVPVDLTGLNLLSQIEHAREVLQRSLGTARRPIVSTKFGPYSAVFLHLVVEHSPDIPVVWVDTGHNTPATLAHANHIAGTLGLNLHIYRPKTAWRGRAPEPGEAEHPQFVERVKLEPFERALEDLRPDVWLSGLRREQTDHRAGLSFYNAAPSGVIKIHPLLNWTEQDVVAYGRSRDLPVEPDYADPTKGDLKRECGLHLKF